MVAKRKLPCKMSPLLPHDTTRPPPPSPETVPLCRRRLKCSDGGVGGVSEFRWSHSVTSSRKTPDVAHVPGIPLMGTYCNRWRNGGQGAVKMANKVNNKLNSITLLFGWNIYFVTFANPGRPFIPVVVTWWPGKVSSAQKDFNLSAKNLLLL